MFAELPHSLIGEGMFAFEFVCACAAGAAGTQRYKWKSTVMCMKHEALSMVLKSFFELHWLALNWGHSFIFLCAPTHIHHSSIQKHILIFCCPEFTPKPFYVSLGHTKNEKSLKGLVEKMKKTRQSWRKNKSQLIHNRPITQPTGVDWCLTSSCPFILVSIS